MTETKGQCSWCRGDIGAMAIIVHGPGGGVAKVCAACAERFIKDTEPDAVLADTEARVLDAQRHPDPEEGWP